MSNWDTSREEALFDDVFDEILSVIDNALKDESMEFAGKKRVFVDSLLDLVTNHYVEIR